MTAIEVRVAELLRGQHGVATRRQIENAGMTRAGVRSRLASGQWALRHRGVIALTAVRATHEQALMAACLAAGPRSAASHLSAAWLLGLVPRPPDRPEITVPYPEHPRLGGVVIHRSRYLDPSRVYKRRAIPYTDPLRIIADLAAQARPETLASVVDSALSRRIVSVDGIAKEAARRSQRGRRGATQLRRLLEDRGFVGGPAPSVLEASAMRLFREHGIPVLGREVHAGSDGRYRIDFLIAPGLAVEVDGFAYHWSPESKAYDDARRNHLRAHGITVLVYDWRSVQYEPRRIADEIRAALLLNEG